MFEYLQIVKKLFFPQHDVKKIKAAKFMAEIEGAAYYGQIVILQDLIKLFGKNPDMTAEECMGECQLRLMEAYKKTRHKLKLKIDNIDLETVMPKEVENDI